ncbi:hypothetical protein PSTT_10833 [Puccinia striiformis]|uniref:Uncharacterized protein n=1 Tax=Puccinia striiformis TaxID=27350 RepID=A0A2S4V2P3_9BASI|nr:hypothetical protein PSTT_10833 [Puccinia striiformis]
MKFFLPIFIFAIALAQAATVRDSPTTRARRRQDYIDGTYEANARVMPDVCPNSSACSIMDSSWPTKGFNCPQKPDSYLPCSIPITLMIRYLGRPGLFVRHRSRYRDGLWRGRCDYGQGMAQVLCSPSQGSKMMKYSNGAWSAIYSITPTCNCVQGVQPKCTRANGLSRDTCNIAVLKFCEMRSGTDLCPPK